jgi:hypothetical protein
VWKSVSVHFVPIHFVPISFFSLLIGTNGIGNRFDQKVYRYIGIGIGIGIDMHLSMAKVNK